MNDKYLERVMENTKILDRLGFGRDSNSDGFYRIIAFQKLEISAFEFQTLSAEALKQLIRERAEAAVQEATSQINSALEEV